MDEFPPPFGPAEWDRLRVIDRRCDLNMNRYLRDSRESRGKPGSDRIWIVSIYLRAGRASDAVRAVHPALKDAVLDALEQAERLGWHEPVAPRSQSA